MRATEQPRGSYGKVGGRIEYAVLVSQGVEGLRFSLDASEDMLRSRSLIAAELEAIAFVLRGGLTDTRNTGP
jgi:hypothetical protein